MADVTGGPVVTNASPFAVPADLTALKDHFGGQAQYSRANAAALPASGNWKGRILMAEDTGALYECTALPGTWVLIAAPPVVGTITPTAGHTISSDTDLVRVGDDVTLILKVSKGSAFASGSQVATVPAGFRPAKPVIGSGFTLAGTTPQTAGFQITIAGLLYVYAAGGGTDFYASVSYRAAP